MNSLVLWKLFRFFGFVLFWSFVMLSRFHFNISTGVHPFETRFTCQSSHSPFYEKSQTSRKQNFSHHYPHWSRLKIQDFQDFSSQNGPSRCCFSRRTRICVFLMLFPCVVFCFIFEEFFLWGGERYVIGPSIWRVGRRALWRSGPPRLPSFPPL